MKGPYERLKYDLRRVWDCPKCHHKERTGGEVTSRLCHCLDSGSGSGLVWMTLVEDGIRRTDSDSHTPSPT